MSARLFSSRRAFCLATQLPMHPALQTLLMVLLAMHLEGGFAATRGSDAKEIVIPDQHLNVVDVAPISESELVALVAPSSDYTPRTPRPLQLARVSLAKDPTIDVRPIGNLPDDGQLWRKKPTLTLDGRAAYIADSDAGAARVSKLDLESGEVETRLTVEESAPIALLADQGEVVLVTTRGVFLPSQGAQPIAAWKDCWPAHAIRWARGAYAVVCSASDREMRLYHVDLGPPDAEGRASASSSLMASINGRYVITQFRSRASAILVGDAQEMSLRLVTLHPSGVVESVTLPEVQNSLRRIAWFAVTSSDRKTWIALSDRDSVRVFVHERNRTAQVADWSFKDPDGRFANVSNIAMVAIGKQPHLMVETQLVAMRGIPMKEGARSGTKISFMPLP